MGVKSGYAITRENAVGRLIDALLAKKRPKIERKVGAMSDDEIASELTRLNDERHGGEGFTRFHIGED